LSDPAPVEEDPKTVSDELRLLYSTAVTEIAGFKQQQWQIANYGLLVYAAIASMPRLFATPASAVERVVLTVAAIAVCVAGWKLISMFNESIHYRRERLTFMRKHELTEAFRLAWRAGKSTQEMPDFPEEKVQLGPFFRAVFCIGLVVTVWLVWR
jgi:hypothetical protein